MLYPATFAPLATSVSVVPWSNVQYWYPFKMVRRPIGGCTGYDTFGPTLPDIPCVVKVNHTVELLAKFPGGGLGGGLGGGGGGDGGYGDGGGNADTLSAGRVLGAPHVFVDAPVAMHIPGTEIDATDALDAHCQVPDVAFVPHTHSCMFAVTHMPLCTCVSDAPSHEKAPAGSPHAQGATAVGVPHAVVCG